MPKASWHVSVKDIDGFERSSFARYTGPIPPTGAAYLWRVTRLRYIAATEDKHPQLWIGLELVPRRGYKEDRYAGYFLMAFRTITANNRGFWVPFLDAVGIKARDFVNNTVVDAETNVVRIGKWRLTEDTYVMAQLVSTLDLKNQPRTDAGWFAEVTEDVEISDTKSSDSDDEFDEDDVDEEDDEEDFDNDEEDDEEDYVPPKRNTRAAATAKGKSSARTTTTRRRR